MDPVGGTFSCVRFLLRSESVSVRAWQDGAVVTGVDSSSDRLGEEGGVITFTSVCRVWRVRAWVVKGAVTPRGVAAPDTLTPGGSSSLSGEAGGDI